jgi:hypothetical protein
MLLRDHGWQCQSVIWVFPYTNREGDASGVFEQRKTGGKFQTVSVVFVDNEEDLWLFGRCIICSGLSEING